MRHLPIVVAAAVLPLVACDTLTAPDTLRTAGVDERVFTGYDAFGFDVFRALAAEQPDSNIVVSPTSLAFALAMTYNGAEGETAREMADVLGVGGMDRETFNRSNRAWLDALHKPSEEVELAIANSIWIRDTFAVERDFVERNERTFDAEVARLDFDDPASVDIINDWVAKKTRDRIRAIVSELEPDEVMLLINALYFLAEWTEPFPAGGTSPAPFSRPDGSTVPIPMMIRVGTIDYHAADGRIMVRLPYGPDGRFSMVLAMPERDGDLGALRSALLSPREWRREMGRLRATEIELGVPRFTTQWQATLNEVLHTLGMRQAFVPRQANFAGISRRAGRDLYIDEVLQKTFLQVNETGTEAAAVTAVRVRAISAPAHPIVHFDRAFLLAIHDERTDTFLFLGQITDPEDPEWESEEEG